MVVLAVPPKGPFRRRISPPSGDKLPSNNRGLARTPAPWEDVHLAPLAWLRPRVNDEEVAKRVTEVLQSFDVRNTA